MTAEKEKLLTTADVARMLQVSRSTVYAMCQRKELAHFRIGIRRGTIRITRQAVDDYITQHTFPPKERP